MGIEIVIAIIWVVLFLLLVVGKKLDSMREEDELGTLKRKVARLEKEAKDG